MKTKHALAPVTMLVSGIAASLACDLNHESVDNPGGNWNAYTTAEGNTTYARFQGYPGLHLYGYNLRQRCSDAGWDSALNEETSSSNCTFMAKSREWSQDGLTVHLHVYSTVMDLGSSAHATGNRLYVNGM